MTLSEELTARGFVYQFSAPTLAEILDGPKRTIYHGIDPSADSAHAGNFVVWLLLRHLHNNGHKVIFLVGGGTGMIGDPKPDAERELKSEQLVDHNVDKIKTQAEHFIGQGSNITFVNNKDWLCSIPLVEFLRDIGKHFTVNELIKKDAIAKRLSGDTGISYTEFAYPLLQGYDYLVLHRTYGCDVQIGGSDQWGNIIAGVDLIRRKEQAVTYALTTPLIIDKATGKKFGKSEGNAVWLDPQKTSPYAFYQFWLNVSDVNVGDYLKLFTFLSLEAIEKVLQDHTESPDKRIAQQTLAEAVTTLVHGEEQTKAVQMVTDTLFNGGDISTLSDLGRSILLLNAPTYNIEQSSSIIDVLVGSGLAASNREAREFVGNGAVTLKGQKVIDPQETITIAPGDLVTLKRGKKQFVVLVGV
ncbi:MAG: hypothetical protein RLZZ70_235 [Candidatus Parcubacteria bacterium]|jgi:tyrosyl-tRNA synthetase